MGTLSILGVAVTVPRERATWRSDNGGPGGNFRWTMQPRQSTPNDTVDWLPRTSSLWRSLPLILATLLAGPTASGTAGRESDESEQIRSREQWFAANRAQGLEANTSARALRRAAAIETLQAAARQRSNAPQGVASTTNRWWPMGPAGARFDQFRFGDVSGRVSALARDAQGILYVGGASGGLWKSIDDGASWISLLDNAETPSVGAIAVDPNDSNVLWIGTGDYNVSCEAYFGVGILQSVDGGLSWRSRNGSSGSGLESVSSFAAMVVDPRDSNHVLAGAVARGCVGGTASPGGVFVTRDAGLTWNERLSGAAVYSLVQDRQDRRILWAGTGQGIFKSIDNGESWIKQTASRLPNNSTGRTELAVAPSDGRIVYALFSGGPTGIEFWGTIDGGVTWTKRSTGVAACDGQCNYNMALTVDPLDPQVIYRGTVWLFKSVDGGETWAPLIAPLGPDQEVHQDIQELLIDPAQPRTLYIGSDGGVWRSDDAGATFTNINANLSLTQFYGIDVHPFDSGQICGGTQDNSSLVRADASNRWQLQEFTGDGLLCQVDPVDPAYVYIGAFAFNGPAVLRSTTGLLGPFNVNISTISNGIDPFERWPFIPQFIVDPGAPNTLYLASQRIYRTLDRGDHWEKLGPADLTSTGRGSVTALDVHRNFSNVVLAGTEDGRVWRSDNRGLKWSDVSSGLPSRRINDLAGDPTNASRAFAVVGGFNTAHLWAWDDVDGCFARGDGLPNVPANSVIAVSRDQLFAATDVGVFRSVDAGHSFEPFIEGLPHGVVVVDLKYSSRLNTLTAGTYGRGVWQVSLEPVAPKLILETVDRPLTEVAGDGDGFVDPGETFEVTARLRNVGGETARGIRASLSTATAGVTIVPPAERSFGNADAGEVVPPDSPMRFTVSPNTPCGSDIHFDLTDVTSVEPSLRYDELLDVLTLTVADRFGPPVIARPLDEDFDPPPAIGWSHSALPSPTSACPSPTKDEWKMRRKDGARRNSFHYGKGPGSSYGRLAHGWLYYGGRDSTQGAGVVIPADVDTVVLRIEHWYNTQRGADGGQVLIDAIDDGRDDYTLLVPEGGYTGTLRSGTCNPLQGKPAFNGKSGGWITSRFDLTRYRGRRVRFAFVFGSDTSPSRNEGWYIDRVVIETQRPGDPICTGAAA